MNEIEHSILAAIGRDPRLGLLVLFGSRARGGGRRDSDVDVAILPRAPEVSRRDLQTGLAVALADLAPGGRVDVVFLDEAPELLRQRIMADGRVLVCRDPASWRRWRVRTMREHGDREHVRHLLRVAQRKRLEQGGDGGRSGHALRSLERTGRLSR